MSSILLDEVRLYAACDAPIRDETTEVHWNGDNHIQNLHVAVKLNFQPFILRYTSPNGKFEYSYLYVLKLESVV